MNEDTVQKIDRLMQCLQSGAARELVVSLQRGLTETRAMPPEHGGDGESAKAAFIEHWLTENIPGIQITHVDAEDPRVPSDVRPNLVCTCAGTDPASLWIFGHMDVVGPGDPASWDSDPFQVVQKGDLLYGRGVEDNQQAIVSMLLLLWALSRCSIRPQRTLRLAFVADEENGSRFGMSHLLQHPESHGLHMDPHDLYLVPDFGSPEGTDIEVAEKSQLWLRITVTGEQCHASTPDRGRNAFVMACRIITDLMDSLPEQYPQENPLFDPRCSTFVPSRHDQNVEAINIVPGKEVFYLDCRILPELDAMAVLGTIRERVTRLAEASRFQASVEIVQHGRAFQTDAPEAVRELSEAIAHVYHVTPRQIGVGGGTVAALLRERNLPALVWSCLDNTCHEPNEHSSVTATVRDSCVFMRLLFPHA